MAMAEGVEIKQVDGAIGKAIGINNDNDIRINNDNDIRINNDNDIRINNDNDIRITNGINIGINNDSDAAELLAQHILEGLGVVTRFAKSPRLVDDACVLEEEMYAWLQSIDQPGVGRRGDASRLFNGYPKELFESAVVRADAVFHNFTLDRDVFSSLHPWARLSLGNLFIRLHTWEQQLGATLGRNTCS